MIAGSERRIMGLRPTASAYVIAECVNFLLYKSTKDKTARSEGSVSIWPHHEVLRKKAGESIVIIIQKFLCDVALRFFETAKMRAISRRVKIDLKRISKEIARTLDKYLIAAVR